MEDPERHPAGHRIRSVTGRLDPVVDSSWEMRRRVLEESRATLASQVEALLVSPTSRIASVKPPRSSNPQWPQVPPPVWAPVAAPTAPPAPPAPTPTVYVNSDSTQSLVSEPAPVPPEPNAEDVALRLLAHAERLLADRAQRETEASLVLRAAEEQARSIVDEALGTPTKVLQARQAAHSAADRACEALRLAAGALSSARTSLAAEDLVGMGEVRDRAHEALAPVNEAIQLMGPKPGASQILVERAPRTGPWPPAPNNRLRPPPPQAQRLPAPPPQAPQSGPMAAPPAEVRTESGLTRREERQARVGLWTRNFGVVTLLFVAFQLWGTDVSQAQSQRRLKDSFVAQTSPSGQAPVSPQDQAGPQEPPVQVPRGNAIAVLEIPAIALSQAVVEGTDLDSLRQGPGHYRRSPFPGESGNVAIAGHRTTYGAPFNRLDELEKGDVIMLTTRTGRVTYEVSDELIVKPSDTSVLAASADDRITLTTCNPKYRMSERLIIVAKASTPVSEQLSEQGGSPPPAPNVDSTAADSAEDAAGTAFGEAEDVDLGGDLGAFFPTLLWIGVLAVIGRGIFILGQRWLRRPAYAMGASVIVIVLYQLFGSLNRLLPAAL